MKYNARTRRASGDAENGGDRDLHCTTGAAVHKLRPAIGEIVAVHGLPGRFVVTSNSDPALVTLENENGVLLRVGERQVVRLEGGAK